MKSIRNEVLKRYVRNFFKQKPLRFDLHLLGSVGYFAVGGKSSLFVVTGLFVRLFINGEMLPDRKIGCHSANTKHLTQATSQRKDGGKIL